MDWTWVLLVAIRAASPSPDDQWATRLTALDQVRAGAFATSDLSRLDGVWAPGSDGRRSDAAAIEAWSARGGHVVGAELRVLTCRVVRVSGTRVRLDVVDQLGPARVTWDDGGSTDLPHDQPTRRTVTLVSTADGWRIGSTRAHRPS